MFGVLYYYTTTIHKIHINYTLLFVITNLYYQVSTNQSCMEDGQIQPTPISKEEYVRFKQWVQDVHGGTRGHLSSEIENALREYRQPDNTTDQLSRIEEDVATLKAQLAEGESDGGSTVVAADARAPRNSNKPHSNQPRQLKVEWFLSEYNFSRDGGNIYKRALEKQLKEAFGFDEGVIQEYIELFIAELDAKEHPDKSGMLVWGDSIEQVKNGEL